MNLDYIISKLDLTVLTSSDGLDAVTPNGGYVSDLLSCVVAGAQPGNIWVTLQAHMNVVAVAALREVSAVIITEDAQPDADVVEKANEQGVVLLSTKEPSFQVVGRLWELGVR